MVPPLYVNVTLSPLLIVTVDGENVRLLFGTTVTVWFAATAEPVAAKMQ
jgi:hypothetical protein